MTDKPKPPNAGGGRPKGALNKNNALLRDAIICAAESAGGDDGLVGYLTKQAKANPKAFLSLLGRVLPLQVANPEGEEFITRETGGASAKLAQLISTLAERRGSAG